MKKTILIALLSAASGLLVGCVYPANLATIAQAPATTTAAAAQASR